MAAIKRFFEKKKLDVKFKKAGGGHRLDEAPAPRPVTARSQSQEPQRDGPSQSASAARDAALARLDNRHKPAASSVGTSSAAIKAQVKKELEAEEKRRRELERYSRERQEVELTAAPVVQHSGGVLFCCPAIGHHVLPKAEMEAEIRRFLEAQLAEEPEMTAALMLHTYSTDAEKVQRCVETISRYLDNVGQHPHEEKYRRIRLTNKAFQDRVVSCEGALHFIQAAGFSKQQMAGPDGNDEDFLLMSEEKASETDRLDSLKEVLRLAEPLRPQLDRNIRVFHPSSHSSQFAPLPSYFFAMSSDEVRREQQARQEAVQKMGMLRTKAMRERDEQREKRRYRYTLIRVRFPDGVLLQATFKALEKLSDVREVVQESLATDWVPFTLSRATGQALTQEGESLVDLGLVPAVVILLAYDADVARQVESQEGAAAVELGLKPELRALLQQL